MDRDGQTLTALAACLHFGNFKQVLWRGAGGVGKPVGVCKGVCARVFTHAHTRSQVCREPGSMGLPHMALLNGSSCLSAGAFPRHSFSSEFYLLHSPLPLPQFLSVGEGNAHHFPPSPCPPPADVYVYKGMNKHQ